jgi:hypothetical protein
LVAWGGFGVVVDVAVVAPEVAHAKAACLGLWRGLLVLVFLLMHFGSVVEGIAVAAGGGGGLHGDCWRVYSPADQLVAVVMSWPGGFYSIWKPTWWWI